MHLCIYASVHVCNVCMYVCMCCMHVCMYECMHVYHVFDVCMHARMHACMHECMYVCMFVCMHVPYGCVNLCNVGTYAMRAVMYVCV